MAAVMILMMFTRLRSGRFFLGLCRKGWGFPLSWACYRSRGRFCARMTSGDRCDGSCSVAAANGGALNLNLNQLGQDRRRGWTVGPRCPHVHDE